MPAFTHLNEFRDVCVETFQDSPYSTLILLNGTEEDMRRPPCLKEDLDPNWNGDGEDCGMAFFKQAFARREEVSSWQWISEPTEAIASVFGNPGHFVADVLWALFPRFHEADPFSQTWLLNDRYCENWFCHTLKAYYKAKNGRAMRMLRHPGPACFNTLYVPQLTRWRWQPNDVPNLEVHTVLRAALTAGFPTPSDSVLLYGHTDGNGRHWKNAWAFEHFARNKGHLVNRIVSFSNMTQQQQCKAFYDAKVIITSHGGQMGNLLCARSGTRIMELSCPPGGGWFASAFKYQGIMGFKDTWMEVPPEYCLNETDNPFFDSFSWPVEDMYSQFVDEPAKAIQRLQRAVAHSERREELEAALEHGRKLFLPEDDLAAARQALAQAQQAAE